MNSHIQIPKCVLREFALTNSGYFLYCVDTKKIVFGYPKTTFTEENYYSEPMEELLNREVESRLGKLLAFARELPGKQLPFMIDEEIERTALVYAKSLIARNPLLCRGVISQSIFGHLLSPREQHDYCVDLAMNSKGADKLLSRYELTFIINKTSIPFVLATRGLVEFAIDGVQCIMTPLNPMCGVIFLEKEGMVGCKDKSEWPIILIPADKENVVMRFNSFAFVHQKKDGIGRVVCHNRTILEALHLQKFQE